MQIQRLKKDEIRLVLFFTFGVLFILSQRLYCHHRSVLRIVFLFHLHDEMIDKVQIPPKAQYFLTGKPQTQHPRGSRVSNACWDQARCSGCAQHAAKKRDTVGEQCMLRKKRALFEPPFRLFSVTQFLGVLKSDRFNMNLGT